MSIFCPSRLPVLRHAVFLPLPPRCPVRPFVSGIRYRTGPVAGGRASRLRPGRSCDGPPGRSCSGNECTGQPRRNRKPAGRRLAPAGKKRGETRSRKPVPARRHPALPGKNPAGNGEKGAGVDHGFRRQRLSARPVRAGKTLPLRDADRSRRGKSAHVVPHERRTAICPGPDRTGRYLRKRPDGPAGGQGTVRPAPCPHRPDQGYPDSRTAGPAGRYYRNRPGRYLALLLHTTLHHRRTFQNAGQIPCKADRKRRASF